MYLFHVERRSPERIHPRASSSLARATRLISSSYGMPACSAAAANPASVEMQQFGLISSTQGLLFLSTR